MQRSSRFFKKAHAEALAGLAQTYAAEKRVGKSPMERLRWLLDFMERPCDALTKGERERLTAEVRMFASSLGSASGPHSVSIKNNTRYVQQRDLDAKELARLSREVGQAISNLLSGEPWKFRPADFGELWTSITGSKAKPRRVHWVHYLGDAPAMFMMAARDLLGRDAWRLARCEGPGCAKVFVKQKRGAYCGKRCSQRARTLRYRQGHSREQLREMRHRWYKSKVGREKGSAYASKVRRNEPILLPKDGGSLT